ncbi:MAG: ATP-binding protein [Candidatus Marinimicrobia bacterium]|nr:ATP-binding protein [Candidatus Neomarinimicrobiota bacterium]
MRSTVIQQWIDAFRDLLQAHQELDQTSKNALEDQLKGEFKFPVLLEQLESTIPQYLKLAKNLPNVETNYDPKSLLQAWDDQYNEAIKGVSRQFSVSIPHKHLQTLDTDSTQIKIWKSAQRTRLRSWELIVSTQNQFRRILKKKQLGKPKFKRRIAYRDYLDAMIHLPVTERLQKIWDHFVVGMAENIILLHERTLSHLYNLMLLQEQHRVLKKKELNEVLNQLREIRDNWDGLSEFIQNIDALEKDIDDQLEDIQIAISKEMASNWVFIGTWLHPNLLNHHPRIENRLRRNKKRLEKSCHNWLLYFEGEKEDRHIDLELGLLQTQISLRLLAGLQAIRDQITHQILPAFVNPHQVINDALKRFREFESSTESKLKRSIASENRQLLRNLRRELLPRILDSLLQARLSERLNSLNSQVKYLMDQLPESHRIFRGQRLSNGKPSTRFMDIEIKALALGEVYPKLSEQFEAFSDSINDQTDKLGRDVTEIDQIIEFNLGAALELLSDEEHQGATDGAYTVVVEGLERTRGQLGLLIEESQHIQMLCQETLPLISQNAGLSLKELADNEKVIQLQIRVTRTKLKQKLLSFRFRVLEMLRSLWPHIRSNIASAYHAMLGWYRRIRKITGLATVPTDIDKQLNLYLSGTRRQIDALPFVYQRLFRFEPAVDERFFIGREQELLQIQKNYSDFKIGSHSSTAIVGESGSGRTSLLNMAETKYLSATTSYRINLSASIHTIPELCSILSEGLNQPKINTIEEIADYLNQKPTQVVFIVENIQNMFLRYPGGFEAIKRFLLLMNETAKHVFWIVSCGLYSWAYFERIIKIGGFFQEIIKLQELDNDTIENVIMKRHRVSGYQLEFKIPESMVRNRRFKAFSTDHERQDMLRKYFFEELNRLAAGNLTVAIIFWLKAVQEIKSDRFIIAPFIEFDPTFLAHMPAQDLFSFAAFLQHEVLTIEDHARVFHQDYETSLLQISRLEKNGMLVRKSGGYQIHYLLYRPVVKTLILHNIIH